MTRLAGSSAASCQTSAADTTNAAIIMSEASPPDTDFGKRRPKNALTRNPASGNAGMRAITLSPFERREGVGVERLPVPEERDDERQADGRLGRRHGHHEEDDDLAVDVAGKAAEGDERQVHGVQHDLDREQDRDQVAAHEDAGRSE